MNDLIDYVGATESKCALRAFNDTWHSVSLIFGTKIIISKLINFFESSPLIFFCREFIYASIGIKKNCNDLDCLSNKNFFANFY